MLFGWGFAWNTQTCLPCLFFPQMPQNKNGIGKVLPLFGAWEGMVQAVTASGHMQYLQPLNVLGRAYMFGSGHLGLLLHGEVAPTSHSTATFTH